MTNRSRTPSRWVVPMLAAAIGLSSIAIMATPSDAQALCRAMPSYFFNPNYRQARKLVRQGRIQEAIPLFRRVARTPRQASRWIAQAWYQTGVKARRTQGPLVASSYFRHALMEQPRHTGAAVRLLDSLRDAGRIREALSELRRFHPRLKRNYRIRRAAKRLRSMLGIRPPTVGKRATLRLGTFDMRNLVQRLRVAKRAPRRTGIF